MKLDKNGIAYTVIFAVVACGVFTAGLAAANEATRPMVAANRAFANQSAVLDALGVAYSDPADAAAKFAASVKPIAGAVPPAYEAELPEGRRWAVETSGAGLWGTITVVVASDEAVTRLEGLEVLAQNETPGLGGRIVEPWFKAQFRGEKIVDGRLRVTTGAEAKGTGDANPDNGVVDGVTGASRTSQAMESIVAAAIARLKTAAGGAK